MDNCAVGSIGIIPYGVFLTAYVLTETGTKYWAQKWSMSKKEYPGTLDITATGSLRSGEMPFDGVIREAVEEVDIPEPYSRANIQSCGSVAYQVMPPMTKGLPVSIIFSSFMRWR
jgi:hypothetical protein